MRHALLNAIFLADPCVRNPMSKHTTSRQLRTQGSIAVAVSRRALRAVCASTLIASTLIALTAGQAGANTISAGLEDVGGRHPTLAEVNATVDPVPAGARIYRFRVTTDSDILALENVAIVPCTPGYPPIPLYNNRFGDAGNANKPNDALIAAFPSLSADTWFDTPGNTSRLGADLPGDGMTTFGDLDANGPQNNFVFAQITTYGTGLLGGGFHLKVRISINRTESPGTPFSQDFEIGFCPEPTTLSVAALAALPLARAGRRKKPSVAARGAI